MSNRIEAGDLVTSRATKLHYWVTSVSKDGERVIAWWVENPHESVSDLASNFELVSKSKVYCREPEPGDTLQLHGHGDELFVFDSWLDGKIKIVPSYDFGGWIEVGLKDVARVVRRRVNIGDSVAHHHCNSINHHVEHDGKGELFVNALELLHRGPNGCPVGYRPLGRRAIGYDGLHLWTTFDGHPIDPCSLHPPGGWGVHAEALRQKFAWNLDPKRLAESKSQDALAPDGAGAIMIRMDRQTRQFRIWIGDAWVVKFGAADEPGDYVADPDTAAATSTRLREAQLMTRAEADLHPAVERGIARPVGVRLAAARHLELASQAGFMRCIAVLREWLSQGGNVLDTNLSGSGLHVSDREAHELHQFQEFVRARLEGTEERPAPPLKVE